MDGINQCEGLEKAGWKGKGKGLKQRDNGNKISERGRRRAFPTAQKKRHDNREMMPALGRFNNQALRASHGQAWWHGLLISAEAGGTL